MWVKRRFFTDTLGTSVATFLAMVFSLLVSVLIARALGPEGKGIVAFVLLVVGQASLILSLGVETSLIHYIGRRYYNVPELSGATVGLAIWLGFIGFIASSVVFLSAKRLVAGPGIIGLLILLASSILLAMVAGYQKSVIRVSGRVVEESVTQVLSSFFTLLAVGTAFLFGLGLKGILVGIWVASVISSMTIIWLSLKWNLLKLKHIRLLAFDIWKRLISYGLKLHIGSILQALNYRFDIYLVAFFLGAAGVGLYSVAVALAEWLWLIPGALGSVLMQRVATCSNNEEANIIMGPINRLTSAVLLISSVFWIMVGWWVIRFLYGEAFTPSYAPMVLLLPGVWALGLWKNLMNDLSVRGFPNSKSYTAGLAVIATVVLNFLLIPRWGIGGAAVASSIAYGIAFLTALWFYCRVTGFRPHEVVLPVIKDFALVFTHIRIGVKSIRANRVV